MLTRQCSLIQTGADWRRSDAEGAEGAEVSGGAEGAKFAEGSGVSEGAEEAIFATVRADLESDPGDADGE